MKQVATLAILVLGLAMLPAAADAANSVTVTEAAAMQGTYGLNLHLDDPASTASTQAYLWLARTRASATNRPSMVRSSSILRTSPPARPWARATFSSCVFYEHFNDASGVKLIFFLHRDEVSGNWFITVWHYDDVFGNYVFTGNGFFALYGNALFDENKIDWEWTAGNPGTLTMYRTLYVDGVPDASGKIQMFTAPTPGMATAGINNVFVGMLNTLSHNNGTVGDLHLDEFVFTR